MASSLPRLFIVLAQNRHFFFERKDEPCLQHGVTF